MYLFITDTNHKAKIIVVNLQAKMTITPFKILFNIKRINTATNLCHILVTIIFESITDNTKQLKCYKRN